MGITICTSHTQQLLSRLAGETAGAVEEVTLVTLTQSQHRQEEQTRHDGMRQLSAETLRMPF